MDGIEQKKCRLKETIRSFEVESDPKGLSPERSWSDLTNQVEAFPDKRLIS